MKFMRYLRKSGLLVSTYDIWKQSVIILVSVATDHRCVTKVIGSLQIWNLKKENIC